MTDSPSERWQRIERLYNEALELHASDRDAFLARASEGDEGLQREVRSLLDYENAAGGFLERPAVVEAAHSLAGETRPPLSGRCIAGYDVMALVGGGGMGEVYRARDRRLGREVAFKVLEPTIAADPEYRRRFEHEAQAASALNHPNVVTIYNVAEEDEVTFITMELVQGHTLRRHLLSGPLRLSLALDVSVQLASALSAAHTLGIVHRDLKPENIMITPDGLVKVLDFGLAKRDDVSVDHGTTVGTLAYMSPEQALGRPAGPQSDQFVDATYGLSDRWSVSAGLPYVFAEYWARDQQTYVARIEANLGRPLDAKLANLGRLLWFDTLHSLHADNTCGGCHSPTNGFGDSQPMAIGVQNNGLVGPHRSGPRNQRRSPLVINTALYPALMWNGRFNSLSGDPFDNSRGFRFPFPEDDRRFSHANDVAQGITHLLQAQAHMPPTELIEVAGFTGTCPGGVPDATLGSAFCQFDDGLGDAVPLPDPATGSRNEPIRRKALELLNAAPGYRALFGELFPEVTHGAAIDFVMFGKAIAEFEFTLVFADAPLDRFARGARNAMTDSQKRGAVLFFGKAGCVGCHRVAGPANEMFSDFAEHVVGVPQVAPTFGAGMGNLLFAGDGHDEDFGLEEITGDPADRYKFRTAPLRNLAVAPGFFHNGAFVRLEDAIRFHLNAVPGARTYDPSRAGLPADLIRVGPVVPLKLLDPEVRRLNPLGSNGIRRPGRVRP